ncbi:hypothetical protein J6590_063554 [Homalodisca vitripennis]|nr:hypothetical protein J6590_063554 [Homalodisca vitripennis]
MPERNTLIHSSNQSTAHEGMESLQETTLASERVGIWAVTMTKDMALRICQYASKESYRNVLWNSQVDYELPTATLR